MYVHPDNYDLGVPPLAESQIEPRFQKASMSHIPYARGEFMTGISAKHTDAILGRYIDLNWDNHDFSAQTRNRGLTLDALGTILKDIVTSKFVKAIRKHGYGLKDSTVTPDEDEAEKWGFMKPPSPNGVMRTEGGFTVIVRPSIKQRAEHQYTIYRMPDGNMYSATYMATHGVADVIVTAANPQTPIDLSPIGLTPTFRQLAELLLRVAEGNHEVKTAVLKLKGDTSLSIQPLDHEKVREYARASFESILVAAQAGQKFDVIVLTGKFTIAATDQRFISLCQEIYNNEFRNQFVALGHTEPHKILSDAMAEKMAAKKFKGKKVAILANAYDGDWMSDIDNGLNYGPGFGASILLAPVSEVNPKGIYLPEITAGTATDKGLDYLAGGDMRASVDFNPAAMIDAKLKVLAYDAAVTKNAELGRIVEIARESFFDHMVNDEGELVHGNYDKTMHAWSAKMDEMVANDSMLKMCIRPKAAGDTQAPDAVPN